MLKLLAPFLNYILLGLLAVILVLGAWLYLERGHSKRTEDRAIAAEAAQVTEGRRSEIEGTAAAIADGAATQVIAITAQGEKDANALSQDPRGQRPLDPGLRASWADTIGRMRNEAATARSDGADPRLPATTLPAPRD